MAGMFRIFIIVCLAVFASIAARADTVMLVAKARVDIEARLEPGDVAMLRGWRPGDDGGRARQPWPCLHAEAAFRPRGLGLRGGH